MRVRGSTTPTSGGFLRRVGGNPGAGKRRQPPEVPFLESTGGGSDVAAEVRPRRPFLRVRVRSSKT
jgi:hypothetical protein